jgi:hypothetical protein
MEATSTTIENIRRAAYRPQAATASAERISTTGWLLVAQIAVCSLQLLARGSEAATVLSYGGMLLAACGLLQAMRLGRQGLRGRAVNCAVASAAVLFLSRLLVVLPHLALFR